MYLKSLEMIGFKSFADRTKLEFEPGLIAIVGPNGCGKSNVSDAIRWVLGEQRPTALRGSKMLDVIFSGTDARKPLGMAEVSITFAECEGALETEFNEVTITRRVFRTGEGSYFINKTPCRLRDIHRLFMGTGIGTNSYSVMAQGQIDAILSSKPEDRRAIFEEAAGITKFKADRKEALRKLEQTEANLLRLTDVIKEVKRQIGSLQRQAGKARRYRELKDRLRGLDLYVTRSRLRDLDERIRELEASLSESAEQEAAAQARLQATEEHTAVLRAAMLENERLTGEATENASRDEGNLQHAHEMIQVSEQRIVEYRQWAERDGREADATGKRIRELRQELQQMGAEAERLKMQHHEARTVLEEVHRYAEAERLGLEQARKALQSQRDESIERERKAARLQNDIAAMDARQQNARAQKNRLVAEHQHLVHNAEQLIRARDAAAKEMEALKRQTADDAEKLATLEDDRQTLAATLQTTREESSGIASQIAAQQAQIDLLMEQEARAEEFPRGSRLLLDSANPLQLPDGTVIGPLAEKFKASAEYRPALEAVLRAWIDAVVLRHAEDIETVMRRLLKHGEPAAARMMAAEGLSSVPTRPPPEGLTRLVDHVEVAEEFRPAADRLLANVFVASTLEDIPHPLPTDGTVVTLSGAVFHAGGCCELWIQEGQTASPLSRRMAIADGHERVERLEERRRIVRQSLETLSNRQSAITEAIREARGQLDESRRRTAQKEGEWQTVQRDSERATQRMKVVEQELDQTVQRTREEEEAKDTLVRQIEELMADRDRFLEELETLQQNLSDQESSYAERHNLLTEARIKETNLAQQVAHVMGRIESHQSRISELESQHEGRSQGLRSYDESIRKLTQQIEETTRQLGPMQQRAAESRARLEACRQARGEQVREMQSAERLQTEARTALDQLRRHHSELDVALAEARVRRQNHFDRVQEEYSLTPEQLTSEKDPDWGSEGPLPLEKAAREVARIGADIEAMGPVNLVAIDEYKELEERFTFLRAQEADMVKSKEQILDLLRMINKKSSELFQATFEQANSNFENMFMKLFNGGTAKLVLLNNVDDPLECGIEIIARPPGKRLQSISLLSGGERTMTAVSLLFAIYMIKPSPFCMLDELDAALDDSNIGRFVQTLKDFLAQSQFLIITHNQHTIASSDIVYGVTMPEKGISKIVSMRLREIGVRPLNMAPEAVPE